MVQGRTARTLECPGCFGSLRFVQVAAPLAYSFDIALQNESSMEENIDLARQFFLQNFVSRGMVVDFAVHSPDKENDGIPNPHFHVMCPIRPILQNGRWGNKQRREYVLDEHGNRIRGDEQAQPKVEIQSLQQEIEVQERQIENLEQFIQRVHKYEDLQELTPYALRELVKAIYIEAPDKSSGKRRQNIRISYDLVGFIPLNELMKQETA